MTMRITLRSLWALALAAMMAMGPGPRAFAQSDGVIGFSPATGRVQPLDVLDMDIVVDFGATTTIGGGVSIAWDPAVFEFVAWDFSTSSLNDDPSFRVIPTLNAAAGTLTNAAVSGSTIVTPGVMATLSLRVLASANTCQSSISTEPVAGNPWVNAVTFNALSPTFTRARYAVGSTTCVAAPLPDDVADMAGRCIGILPEDPLNGATCPNPVPQDWTVAPLFDALNVNGDLGILEPLTDHMARYCAYELRASASPLANCRVLAGDIERVRPGMVLQSASMTSAVQSGGSSLANLLKGPLQNQFLEQGGFVSIPLAQAGDGSVELAIIDTMESGLNNAPSARAVGGSPAPSHGFALDRFRDMLSSGMDIRRKLPIALPFNCFAEQTCLELCGVANGCPDDTGLQTGFLGTPESAARAVHTAVREWSFNRDRSRLVINASIGWRPQFNTVNGELRAGYRAFVDSLVEAACLGAVVIAAAGNENSGPDQPAGLLAPASASALQAPTGDDCMALGYRRLARNFGAKRPIAYPVGAVDAADQQLLTRTDGEPPLVAFGDHATRLGPSFTGGFLPTLTGSSVASIVVATAAASAWTAIPDASPDELMDLITLSARPVGRSSDICLPNIGCATPVRRVTVCAAYAAACELGGLDDCPVCTDPPPTQFDPGDDVLDDVEAAFDNAMTRTIDFSGYQQYNDVDLTACNGASPYRYYQSPDAPAPLNPCPQDQYYPTLETPWATGQPEHQSCEDCGMTERSPGKMSIEIRDDFGTEFKDPTLFDATLLCRDRDTGLVNAFRLPDTDPDDPTRRGHRPGDRLFVTNIDNTLCPGDDIRLSFTADATDANDNFQPASLVQKLIVIRHDEDDDAVPDFRDNCVLGADPTQRDTDGDGIGNICDGDIAQPNDCFVNVLDLAVLKLAFFAREDDANWNPDADFNGDGVVNLQDLGRLRALFFGTPGPSALDNACAE